MVKVLGIEKRRQSRDYLQWCYGCNSTESPKERKDKGKNEGGVAMKKEEALNRVMKLLHEINEVITQQKRKGGSSARAGGG